MVQGAHDGEVLVCGSHAGINACLFAAAARLKAAIFNDAGVGKDAAGIAGLVEVERFGMAAAAVDFRSARIGDGRDTFACGIISFLNRWAEEAGVSRGMAASAAVSRMARWIGGPLIPRPARPVEDSSLVVPGPGLPIVAFDSVSSVDQDHIGEVVVTGSHGGLVNGRAVKVPVSGAFFNDAGVGKEQAGISRLLWLADRGVPAATIDCESARIGSGMDTYENGVLSFVNAIADQLGLGRGQRAREAAQIIALHGRALREWQ